MYILFATLKDFPHYEALLVQFCVSLTAPLHADYNFFITSINSRRLL
jgi:hypothetical protein